MKSKTKPTDSTKQIQLKERELEDGSSQKGVSMNKIRSYVNSFSLVFAAF